MDWHHYIWDVDGTLIDSYGSIVSCLEETLAELGHRVDRETITRTTKLHSVMGFLEDYGQRLGFDPEAAKRRYAALNENRREDIPLLPGAAETLHGLLAAGAKHYVFTHRGSSTEPILRKLGIADCFTELVSVKDGWHRKPDPQGLHYLMEKYCLSPAETCYVGDRALDVACAKNAGIGAVLLLPSPLPGLPTGQEDRVILTLTALL